MYIYTHPHYKNKTYTVLTLKCETQAGQQMKQKAQGAAEVVKDKTGLNKNT